MDDRVTRIGAVVVLAALGLASCQTSTAHRKSDKGEQLLARNRNAEAVEHFEQAYALSTDPLKKARAALGLGQARVKMGQYRAAKTALYDAQNALQTSSGRGQRESSAQRRERDTLEIQINRWIGEACLDGAQLELAQRYLLRALPGLEGGDREVVLAELSFLAREAGDVTAAARFRRELSRPYSSEIAAIIDGKSARMNQAHLKLASRRSAPSRRAASQATVRRSTPTPRARSTRRSRPLPIQVFGREDWNARKPRTSRIEPMGKISRITIHHSAGKSFWAHSHRDTASHIRSIQRYHQDEKKWADIGYHYIIDRTGNIWEGRPRSYQGAHAGGQANRGNLGIVVLGNYTRQGLNESQVRSLANLIGQLSDRYGIPHYRVYTHEEIQPGHTACPGPVLTRVVAQIRGKLRERHLAMGK